MTLRLTALCGLLAASASVGQTMVVTPQIAILRVDDPNVDTFTFGAAQCSDTVTLQWSNTLAFATNGCSQNPLKLWSTAGECGDTKGTNDTSFTDVPALTLNTARTGTFQVKISELPDFKTTTSADGGTLIPCGSTTPIEKVHRICGSVSYVPAFNGCVGTAQVLTATSLKLVYDTLPPSVPEITGSSPQDQGVRVVFTVDADTSVVLLEVKGPTDADFRQIADTSATNGLVRGTGLENNVPYEVRLRAQDAAGNVSDPTSEALTITPIRTLGFWGYYKDAGGSEQGCSVGAGLMPLLFAAFAFRRKSKQVKQDSGSRSKSS
jgi:hypothetical protein